jgi:general L-amino acid transport system substrate-binding protein
MNRRFSMMGAALLIIAIIYSACAAPAAAPAASPAVTEAAPVVTEAAATTTEAAPAAAVAAPAAQAGSLLDTVRERGKLICGVNNQVPGFGVVDQDGNFAGFDVDFCKAVAAAVLGDANAVEYKYADSNSRFTLVKTGEIDVLFRNSTWTTTRDSAEVGLDWLPVNFYDGQGMMVRKDSGIETIEDLDGATICVQSGTTTELNLADYFRARGLAFEPVVFDDNNKTFTAYDEGRCDAYTTDKSGLVSTQTKMQVPADHMILAETMSKEPLAGAVVQGDPTWADALRWVVLGVIQAEESGVTAANVQEMLASEDPTIKRLLGVEGELGSKLGLSNDFMVKVLEQVGNYGEIWNRNLGPDTPFNLPRDQNDQWTNGGLLYSPPFR